MAVADVFDALAHERPYKRAWAVADAVSEVVGQAGTQFDPAVVEAFRTLDHASLLSPVRGWRELALDDRDRGADAASGPGGA